PCSNSSGLPVPVRATWKAAPLALRRRCSIIGVSLNLAGERDKDLSFRALSGHSSSPRTRPRPPGKAPDLAPWRGGRVVECTALEMRHRCKPIGGSNPSLSANLLNGVRRRECQSRCRHGYSYWHSQKDRSGLLSPYQLLGRQIWFRSSVDRKFRILLAAMTSVRV